MSYLADTKKKFPTPLRLSRSHSDFNIPRPSLGQSYVSLHAGWYH